MATDLEIIGPISIPFQKSGAGSAKHIGKAEVKAFWATKEAQDIADKQGCYVFALQAAKGFRPWYVGKATKSMGQECMQTHSLAHYNEVLFKGNKGTPVLFFVVLGGNKKKVSAPVIGEMETFFIQTVLTKHPEHPEHQSPQVDSQRGCPRRAGRTEKERQRFPQDDGLE